MQLSQLKILLLAARPVFPIPQVLLIQLSEHNHFIPIPQGSEMPLMVWALLAATPPDPITPLSVALRLLSIQQPLKTLQSAQPLFIQIQRAFTTQQAERARYIPIQPALKTQQAGTARSF